MSGPLAKAELDLFQQRTPEENRRLFSGIMKTAFRGPDLYVAGCNIYRSAG